MNRERRCIGTGGFDGVQRPPCGGSLPNRLLTLGRRIPERVEEQLNQGSALNVRCAYCGAIERDAPSREERAEHYQILVACAQCGNEFAAISRN